MDLHVIQSQDALLERESIAELNLLQAQERLKAIRTMRKHVLAIIEDQSNPAADTHSLKIAVMNNASTPKSTGPVESEDLPHGLDEVKDLNIDHSMSYSTLSAPGCSCSEPDIALSLSPEPRPQSVPANHCFTNAITYKYDISSHPSLDRAQDCINSPHCGSLDVVPTTSCSEPPLQPLNTDDILEYYTSKPLFPDYAENSLVYVFA